MSSDFSPLCCEGTCVMGQGPQLKVENLSVCYGEKRVLEQVDLKIEPCSVTALIGPSGCGKTTFLTSLNRMTDMIPGCRVEGSIKFGSQEILSPSLNTQELRKKMGMVFQRPNPFPLSIWKNLALPLKYHRIGSKSDREAMIEGVLREVGLWQEVKDRLHHSALALSGGQQQRLCIARALVLAPEILLFDEPCSALDPLSTETIEDLILSLRSRFTVVIVTHNLQQARRVADYAGVFWNIDGVGRVIERGTKKEIFDLPQHPKTAAYVASRTGT